MINTNELRDVYCPDDSDKNLVKEAADEIDKLRAIVIQFGDIHIPSNWPADCRLRIDNRSDGSEYIAYHGINDDGILPRIAAWRAARSIKEWAYTEGYNFRMQGNVNPECRYHEGTEEFNLWFSGFYDADDNVPPRF
jgi:hypothetical protein